MKKVLFPILALVLAFGLALPMAAAAIDPDPGLVALWHFDEGSGALTVADSSGNGNTGTVVGATTGVVGKFSNALRFDGINDYVEVPDPGIASSLDLDRATLEAWIYIDPTLPTGFLNIVRKGHGLNRTYGLDIGLPGPRRMRGWANLGPAGNSTALVANGATTLATGQWYHVAMTYDGSRVRVYVGGILDGISGNFVGNIFDNNLSVRIGGQPSGDSQGAMAFKGLIDEVRIWSTALNASQLDDVTPPVVTATADPVPNAAGWNNTDVTVTFSATDTGGSGVETVTSPVTVTEGASQVITG
ncbi:MAG: LamG domain-containing protein, partial [Dehalococcoidales bacterium]|nr:LamG domain-containing protein [Dehalococcoidales bacterium]